MCGKYSRSTSSAALYLGSPPHVREIPLVALENYFSIRITPACAGNTCQSSPSLFSFKDHPRMCGKYQRWICTYPETLGSPPHVREIHVWHIYRDVWCRITPACAGNTSCQKLICLLDRDHPRMCGKYTKRSLYDATCNLRIPFFHSLLNFQFIS